MTKDNQLSTLEDVLNAYVAANPSRSRDVLAEWMRRYPQYEHELTEFTVNWSLATWLPRAPDRQEVDEETLVLRGMSVAQDVLHNLEIDQSPADEQSSIRGLQTEGVALGLSLSQLADRAKLSIPLIRKFDRRLIRYTSVPLEVLENLANAIQCSVSRVARYLQHQPRFAPGARYRSERTPTLAEPESFFDAIRNDRTMKEEWRTFWLSLAQQDGSREDERRDALE